MRRCLNILADLDLVHRRRSGECGLRLCHASGLARMFTAILWTGWSLIVDGQR